MDKETLDDLLADVPASVEVRLAMELAKEDQHLLGTLVQIRKDRGLSQEQLADALGVSQATISSFERIGNDPHLSTLRRYCRALGVLVRHQVDPDPDFSCTSHSLTHMSSDAVYSTKTAAATFRRLPANVEWPAAATATNFSLKDAVATAARVKELV